MSSSLRAASAAGAIFAGLSFSVQNAPRAESSAAASSFAPPAPALSPSEFRALTVKRVDQLTRDTKRITFKLPEGAEWGGSTASCLVVKATAGGKDVIRPYTPTSPAHQRDSMELIVKTYREGKASKCVIALN